MKKLLADLVAAILTAALLGLPFALYFLEMKP